MCPQVALTITCGGAKIINNREKAPIGRGGVDLCQGGPGVDPGHIGRESHPPID